MALAEIGARLRLAGAGAFRRETERTRDSVDRLGREADRSSRRVGGLDGALRKIGKGVAFGGLAAAGAGIALIGSNVATGLRSLGRIEMIGAQTDAALKSTGAVARVTRDSIDGLAGRLEALTATEAESTTQGANLLLTFTNIRNGVGEANHIFDQAVEAMVDYSRAMDKTGGVQLDMTGQAIQLGKALNDPIKGVTALGKAGVQFTKEQREQIKTLVESGKIMDAQKIILKELKVQFGGSGAAFGQTTLGKIERFKHAFGTMQETIASALLPTIEELTNWLVDKGAPAVEEFGEKVKAFLEPGSAFRDKLEEMTPKLKAVAEDVGVVLAKMADLIAWMVDNQGTVKTFAAAIATYAVAVRALAVAAALAAAVKWIGLATGITAVGTAAGTAGAAGGIGAATAALGGLATMVAVGGPLALGLATIAGLLWTMNRDSEALNARNVLSGTPTVNTMPQRPASDTITLNGRTVPRGQGAVEIVPPSGSTNLASASARLSSPTGTGPIRIGARTVSRPAGNSGPGVRPEGVVRSATRPETRTRVTTPAPRAPLGYGTQGPTLNINPAPVTLNIDGREVGRASINYVQERSARR